MADQPTAPMCAECHRIHIPGRLNAFDDGMREDDIPCTCEGDCSELICTSTCTCTCEPCADEICFRHPHLYYRSPEGLCETLISMYANGMPPSRCCAGWVVNYEGCTPTELKTFIINRGIPDPYPEGLTLSFYYIKLLDAADRSPSVFRFMDLPAELRNMVYKQLFTFSKAHEMPGFQGSCHPEILSTCRSIHYEASDLPYANNTINIFLRADWRKDFRSGRPSHKKLFKDVQIQNRGVRGVKKTVFEAIPNGVVAWPEFLRRVRKLSIEINLIRDKRVRDMRSALVFARDCLATLVAFLMDEHRLTDLDVVINGPRRSDFGVIDVLLQLRRLNVHGNVSIRGVRVHGLGEVVARCMKNPAVIYINIINDVRLVFDKVDALKAMHVAREQFTRCEDDPVMRGLIATMMKLINDQRENVLCTLAAGPGIGGSKDAYVSKMLVTLQRTVHAMRSYV